MGELFGPMHLLVLLIAFWQIVKKAGFPPAFSILVFVPLVNLIVLYYVAFSDWKPGASSVTPI